VDAVTRDFHHIAGPNWRDIRALSDDGAADLIRRDRIDILVDTGGHTGANRLMIFARKPAPVQITWLGYPDTTGLRSIDYRITDSIADPRGLTDALYSEQLIRLHSFLCYQPPDYTPAPGPPPALRNGFVTFGSFNNFMKLSPGTIAAWAEILNAVPGSCLMLKHRGSHDRAARDAFPAFFESHGIARERIVITLQMPAHNLHLESYNEIDIALDPWPYNGTTTSCEALAMGVPFVTLAGRSHVARVGVSLLTQVGLADWIAASAEEYVRLAIRKAAGLDALAEIRRRLPARLAASPLGDVGQFVDALEELYRSVAR
jgi:predicted O-linked N-acetylglucosamine transferase (SPINDLY family)